MVSKRVVTYLTHIKVILYSQPYHPVQYCYIKYFLSTGLYIQSVSCEYVLIQQQKTWDEAQVYCRQNHVDLATVQSTEDWTNVQRAAGSALTSPVWTGLYNDINTWRWSYQDEPLTYLSWFSGEPNNRNGVQECASFYGGTWHDMVCTETKLFLCYNENQVGANRFVLVTDVARSWSDAQIYCRQHHTDLATIRTEAENDQLSVMKSSYSYAWIGLFRDTWKWSDGTNVSMSSINRVFSFGDVTDQDRPCSIVTSDGWMDDWICSAYQNFICKLRKKKQLVRLEMISGKNVNDPAVMGTILQSLKQKLKDHGIEKDTTLTWRLQPDENVFTPKHYEDEERTFNQTYCPHSFY
ncbi:putative L-selectin-like [Triplophysa rosa]|uniref:L-selectin-like n=1 Tax=Triplophysa rosa TaxID=992332 RepID=A0A9W7T3J5_TRIRA|nr:putative L-selectin-like [Triplophysa rosa]